MADFDYFAIFAEMRTGSNFLEENLNDYPGLTCHGEVFNPFFIGHANKQELFGVTLEQRERDPAMLLGRMRAQTAGLAGFRIFHDHDRRMIEHALGDRRCAKIVLTRNPVDSYVSRKIARATGQWRLNDMKHARSATVKFDAAEFHHHLEVVQGFQMLMLRELQISGQTAFYIGYDDLRDVTVLDGLAAFLGVDHRKKRASQATKVQNPASLRDKVENFDEMESALAGIDMFDLARTPNFEPRRAASVPDYVAAAEAPLLFLPIKGGPERRIWSWLAAIDGKRPDALTTGFTQKTLRQWKRRHKGHRSFTIVRHPVARLHTAFVRHILGTGPGTFGEMREILRKTYRLPIPAGNPDANYTAARHRTAFLEFIRFVQGNLNGQTGLRVDASWGSQTEVLHGIAQVQVPDFVLREVDLERGLAQLAGDVGLIAPALTAPAADTPFTVSDIYDDEVEAAVRAAYQRDYMMFGFKAWEAPPHGTAS